MEEVDYKRVGEIMWTDKPFRLRELPANFGFPLLIKVTKGSDDMEHKEKFSTGEVINDGDGDGDGGVMVMMMITQNGDERYNNGECDDDEEEDDGPRRGGERVGRHGTQEEVRERRGN